MGKIRREFSDLRNHDLEETVLLADRVIVMTARPAELKRHVN